jgi:cytochrome c biogenesis protein CcdA
METYLFIALFFIYILTAFMLPKILLKKIWTIAYIISFIITGISVFYIKIYATDTLMKVGELNWYYILYVFGSITLILGVILLWIYKKPLYTLFTNKSTEKHDTNQ